MFKVDSFFCLNGRDRSLNLPVLLTEMCLNCHFVKYYSTTYSAYILFSSFCYSTCQARSKQFQFGKASKPNRGGLGAFPQKKLDALEFILGHSEILLLIDQSNELYTQSEWLL